MLKIFQLKIFIIILLYSILHSCSLIKKIPDGQKLLVEEIFIKNNKILKKDPIKLLSVSPPNSKIFGMPIRLYINNLVIKNPDSSFNIWLKKKKKREQKLNSIISSKQVNQLKKYRIGINNWFEQNSEKPILALEENIKENKARINQYFKNVGYFKNKVTSFSDSIDFKKTVISYNIETGKQYIIDSVSSIIKSKDLENIYKNNIHNSFLIKNEPFKVKDFDLERERLVKLYRNNGIYDFQQSSIRFKVFIDSQGLDTLIPVTVEVSDIKKRTQDGLFLIPYNIKKIKKVNVYIEDSNNTLGKYSDSISFNDVVIFYNDKLNYKPQAITNAITLTKDNIYNENERANTFRYFTELKNFKYPSITFKETIKDSLGLDLSVILTPMERFSLGFDLDLSHSNIEDFGISLGTSVITRNIFKGTEILELSVKGSLGSSRNAANSNSDFFNLFEIGTDLRLKIPRILFPININSIIPRSMFPKTNITIGTSLQENIGLDRQNFASIIEYEWTPSKSYKLNFKLLDLEFIKNRAINNYFNVYRNSYDRLNSISQDFYSNPNFTDNNGSLIIPEGALYFIEDVVNNRTPIHAESIEYQNVLEIKERQERLTSDNFILGSSLSFIKNNQQNILDENFSQFRFKIEWVGNLINSILSINNKGSSNQNNFLDVLPSQFIKTEFNYIKHWKIGFDKVLAFRGFSGIAIPYGNSNSIPFTRSYFGGGSNDNRAWKVYKLGPGISKNKNEFNEANFKIAFNLEYRIPILGAFKGAIFIDAGNIWNALDNIKDSDMRFDGFKDLKELAVGTGFGIRYDFNFFIFRLDTGFKAYNPVLELNERWWSQTSFKNAVFNIGINYPF
tara:strand:- start:251 stop:2794 length:2544 start_codon:yes stop_codon:yes gene_type:complete